MSITSCQNITTVNSSVPESWWSMWQSRRWCDTWDPDHGLEGPLFPHSLLALECLFASRLVLRPDKRLFPSDTFSGHKNRQQCNPFSGAYIVQGGGGGHRGKCTTIVLREMRLNLLHPGIQCCCCCPFLSHWEKVLETDLHLQHTCVSVALVWA